MLPAWMTLVGAKTVTCSVLGQFTRNEYNPGNRDTLLMNGITATLDAT